MLNKQTQKSLMAWVDESHPRAVAVAVGALLAIGVIAAYGILGVIFGCFMAIGMAWSFKKFCDWV